MLVEKECSLCKHEEVDWMPFYEIEKKTYCGMCINLAFLCREEHEQLRNNGFKIITSNNNTCGICSSPASFNMPLFQIKHNTYCASCITIGIRILFEDLKNLEENRHFNNQIIKGCNN